MKKNYNRLAMQGVDIDDMEFVSQFGLDPDVAYTPKINDSMIEKVHENNMKAFKFDGYPEREAKKKADKLAFETREELSKLL